MNKISDETLAIVCRYADKQGRGDDHLYKLELMAFAGYLLRQNSGDQLVMTSAEGKSERLPYNQCPHCGIAPVMCKSCGDVL